METLRELLDVFLHLDDKLIEAVQHYGLWTYAILFAIVFCETGLVVTPFLPGDSLLFAAGALAATGALELPWLIVLLAVAAVAGDAVNYSVGHFLGPRVLERDGRFLKRKYLEKTRQFYARYGTKTIVLARFVPIVRTFAPFLAGVGEMSYPRFAMYNVSGGMLWIAVFLLSGYWFGNIEVVKRNFELVVLGIIFVSVLPGVYEAWRARRESAAAAGTRDPAAV